MDRILEPEIMDDEQQAIAYASADFSSSNQMFVDGMVDAYASRLGTVLDIGCGPGDIPIRLAQARSSVYIVAVDASDVMVRLANDALDRAGLARRVQIVQGRIPGLRVRRGGFDAIISKDLLHHLPDPMVFWEEVKRLGRPGTVLYGMDLFRPATPDDAKTIVESVSANEPKSSSGTSTIRCWRRLLPMRSGTSFAEPGLALRSRSSVKDTCGSEGRRSTGVPPVSSWARCPCSRVNQEWDK